MTPPRILVTDAQERAVLAAVRCLRAEGFSVTATGTTRMAPGLWSRAPSQRHVAPDPRRSVEGFVSRLEEILRASRHDVMLAGMDASLLAISRHRQRLAPYVTLALPSHDVVEHAFDRERLIRAAANVGLTPPESRVCDGEEETVAVADEFGYPVLVKPLHAVVEAGGVMRRRAAVVASDVGAVRGAARSFQRCIVQRRISGQLISFGGVAAEDRLLSSVVSQYMRTWPVEGGNVSFSQTVCSPAGLTERVQALVGELGWTGLFELELILRENGELAAIDFNPRPYGSLALAVAAGAPLPAVWCQWLVGTNPSQAGARAGMRYRWEDADLRHLAQQLRQGHIRSALAVATPRRGVTHAYFRLGDPAPAVARAFQVAWLARERSKNRDER